MSGILAILMYWYLGELRRSQTLEIPIDHPALIYGATVFTTLRVYGNLEARLTHWQAHCDRLANSVAALGWAEPDWEQIRRGAIAIAENFPVIRITLFPEGEELITGRALPNDLETRQQQGISAWVAAPSEIGSFTRSLPNHKTGNYLAPWLALRDARSHQTQEAILVNEQGHWLETSTGNLWGWMNNQWYTPPLETGILPGLMRQKLMDYFRDHSMEVQHVMWDHTLVKELNVLLYTNSVMEAIPISVVYNQSQTLGYETQHPAIDQLRGFFLESGAE